MLPAAQRLTDAQLVAGIGRSYYIQLFLLIVCFVVLSIFVDPTIAFWSATGNPLTRFELFRMGVYAGLLCLRVCVLCVCVLCVLCVRVCMCDVTRTRDGDGDTMHHTGLLCLRHMKDPLPWQGGQLFVPKWCHGTLESLTITQWVSVTDRYAGFLLAITLLVATLDGICRSVPSHTSS